MSDYGFMEEWKNHVLSKEDYETLWRFDENYSDEGHSLMWERSYKEDAGETRDAYKDYLKGVEYSYHTNELNTILEKLLDAYPRYFVFQHPFEEFCEEGWYMAFVENDEEASNVPRRPYDKYMYFCNNYEGDIYHYQYIQDAIDFFIDDVRVDTFDLGLFDDEGDWNFYLSEDEMTYLGFEDEIERQREYLEVEDVLE